MIEQGESEGGERGEGGEEGEDGGKEEERGHEVVMGETITVEEIPKSEVDGGEGDVAVLPSPDGLLVSASKTQPSPLENITEEDEEVEEDMVDRAELLTRCKVC